MGRGWNARPVVWARYVQRATLILASESRAERGRGYYLLGVSLRFILVTTIAAFAVLDILVSGLLIVFTARLGNIAHEVGDSVENIHLAEEMEVTTLTHNRTRDPEVMLSLEADLRQLITDAWQHLSGEDERLLLQQLDRALEGYFVASHAALRNQPASPAGSLQPTTEFDTTFVLLRRFVYLNLMEGRRAELKAARWRRFSTIFGTAGAAIVFLSLMTIIFWLRVSAFRPASDLSAAIERYVKGDKTTPAPEQGPREFRSIAERFNQLTAELAHQRERQMAFLAGVAHDLRNPLSALKVASSMVAPEKQLPPEPLLRQIFGRQQKQMERLERMVWDLLDATRIEAGILELRMEVCDLRDVVRGGVEVFESASPRHHILLRVPDRPVATWCDPARIEQVVSNLVSNAIKYSPKGGTVEVRVARDPVDALITVTDQGVGISASEIANLFKPFRRAGPTRETISGIGLGLYVAHQIIEGHHGRLEVRSVAGEGSVFEVRLPRLDTQPVQSPNGPASSPTEILVH